MNEIKKELCFPIIIVRTQKDKDRKKSCQYLHPENKMQAEKRLERWESAQTAPDLGNDNNKKVNLPK